MSVRRLADAIRPAAELRVQPRRTGEWAQQTIQKYPKGRQQSAVIPLMMRAQEQEGWVTKPAIEAIADMLGMPYIRALEVATFYTQFQLKPVGRRAHVQVCGTTPCMLRGAEALMDVCRKKIHHEQFHTNDARHAVLGRGRVPRRLRQRADGDDLQGHLRGSDAGAAGRDHRPVRDRQGRRRAGRTAERPHRVGAAIGPDVAERRERRC